MNLSDFKAQYPAYKDIPDPDLADALHAKYYSTIPRDEFMSQIGVAKPGMLSDVGQAVTSEVKGMGRSATDLGRSLVGGVASGAQKLGLIDQASLDSLDERNVAAIGDNLKEGEKDYHAQTVPGKVAQSLANMAPSIALALVNPAAGMAAFAGQADWAAARDAIQQGHGLTNAQLKGVAQAALMSVAGEFIGKGTSTVLSKIPGMSEAVDGLAGAVQRALQGMGIMAAFKPAGAAGSLAADVATGETADKGFAPHTAGEFTPGPEDLITGALVTVPHSIVGAVQARRAGAPLAPGATPEPAATSAADMLQAVRPMPKSEPPIEAAAQPILDAKSPEEAIAAAAKLTETPVAPIQSVAQTVAALAPEATPGVPTQITAAMRQQLTGLGWKRSDIAGMTPAAAWDRINRQEAKNAAQTGQVEKGGEQEHLGIPPGQDLRADQGQVRGVNGEPAGGGGGVVERAPAPGPDQLAQQVAATKIPGTPEAAAAATTDHLEAAKNLTRSPETKAVIEQELQARQEAPQAAQVAPPTDGTPAPEVAQPAPEPQAAAPVPEVPSLLGKPITEASDRALKAALSGPKVEAAQAEIARRTPQREATAAQPEPQREAAPVGEPVETFAGTYKEGMNQVAARQKMLELAAKRPELDWRVEPSDGLKYPFVVKGYQKVGSETEAGTGTKEAAKPVEISIGREHNAVNDGAEPRFVYGVTDRGIARFSTGDSVSVQMAERQRWRVFETKDEAERVTGAPKETPALDLPKKLTKSALEKLSARVKDMSPEEKQATLKWHDEQVKAHEAEGKRIADHCL